MSEHETAFWLEDALWRTDDTHASYAQRNAALLGELTRRHPGIERHFITDDADN